MRRRQVGARVFHPCRRRQRCADARWSNSKQQSAVAPWRTPGFRTASITRQAALCAAIAAHIGFPHYRCFELAWIYHLESASPALPGAAQRDNLRGAGARWHPIATAHDQWDETEASCQQFVRGGLRDHRDVIRVERHYATDAHRDINRWTFHPA